MVARAWVDGATPGRFARVTVGDLTFLRPLWLLGVLLAPALVALLWWRMERVDPWRRVCDPDLLLHLRTLRRTREGVAPFLLAGLLGVTAAVGLAGPTWSPTEIPLFRTERAMVVVLDLSRSMDATDVSPSRLERARVKVRALLERNADGQSGLVVFAGDAFAVAPLTSDAGLLGDILPAFDTSVLPEQGSRPDRALRRAAQLLTQSGRSTGEVVLVSDGARNDDAIDVATGLLERGFVTSVLAVGTARGGRVPIGGGVYLRNLKGEELVAPTSLALLESIARAGGGRFAHSAEDPSDIEALFPASEPAGGDSYRSIDREVQIWLDRGPWIALALVPLAAAGFRRGWLVALAALILVPLPPPAAAQTTPAEIPTVDAGSGPGVNLGTGFRWEAVGRYRERRFRTAAELFARGDRADDHYNRGNALALAGLYQAALAAYSAAIARAPVHEDARFNRAIVEQLVEQQSRQQSGRDLSAEDLELIGDQGEASDGLASATSEAIEARTSESSSSDSKRTGEIRERDLAEVSDQLRDRPIDGEQTDAADREREAAGQGLSATQVEAMEAALNEITEDRSGLWKRKFELKWKWRNRALGRSNSRPDRSDAW